MSLIVITGFMGTGKSTVAREVARQLGRPFVDMDAEIEARAGKPIHRIFAEDGEETFRQMESDLCAELAARDDGLVIATGGGTLVNPRNQERMRARGTVICLTADLDEILRRMKDDGSRPLLSGPDRREKAKRLLEARREAYDALPWHVDTTGLPIEEVVRRVLAIARAVTISVRHPTGAYPIILGEGLLDHVGDVLRQVGFSPGTRIAVVSNPVVAPLYADRVIRSLAARGLSPFLCLAPDGEAYKTVETVVSLYEQFLDGDLDRSGAVLALGGGVVGDEAGFAAATFMRGVRFVQVPTTLLAMVDASIGGKTGVDLPRGKNLVGAFQQPEAVVIDPETLRTLPWEEVRAGMAEVIKHAVIGDAALLAELEAEAAGPGPQLPDSARLARALAVKVRVVEEDPLERGGRAVLNLGHTVGHALEQASGYTMRHGEAVGIGMMAEVRIAIARGEADPSPMERLERLLSAWGLPTRCPPYPVDALMDAMACDKKRQRGRLRWIIPRAPGDVYIADDVPPDLVRRILREMGAGE